MYQRNGRMEPHAIENAFIPRIGNPTPAKPKAGETMSTIIEHVRARLLDSPAATEGNEALGRQPVP